MRRLLVVLALAAGCGGEPARPGQRGIEGDWFFEGGTGAGLLLHAGAYDSNQGGCRELGRYQVGGDDEVGPGGELGIRIDLTPQDQPCAVGHFLVWDGADLLWQRAATGDLFAFAYRRVSP